MPLFQKLKNVFTRNEFDYESPDLDLYKFHPQIRIFLVFNGIFFNNAESNLRFCWPVLSTMLTFVGASMELMFIYHGIDTEDYSFATECFCYFLILSTVPLVYTSALSGRIEIVNLLNSMNQDFLYICKLECKYRRSFLRGQLIIWQLYIAWFVFVMALVTAYIISTLVLLLYQSLFASQTENMVRPMMFPLWLPADDPYRTPNYEIFFLIETALCLIVPQTFCVYIYVFFHTLLHHYYLMDMIFFDFEVLFNDLKESVVHLSRDHPDRIHVQLILNKRISRIVKWHNLVFKTIDAVSSVYGPPLVYQVMFSSICICLIAYQVAESLDDGKFHVLFAMLCIATCIQLWIPCYLGTLIRNKALSVGDAAWNSGWYETPLGRLVRQSIIIIIMRSQKPVSIKFTGLPNVELETFSSVISTSYSYFNILRQYK
ncbi:odorant receptor 49b-like [Melitaea cinxia]|uniref:odorant receptor 49b-like n=1 Tax=Melitaea cinxia TaxID=113334 RepID=UPI001E274315|nr:odorant receptor 49b-like [Melitaea cinxia]